MSSSDKAGRISKHAFVITSIFMLVVSVLAAFCRILIRLRQKKRLFVDDGFLLFGLACLCVATAISWRYLGSMYLIEAMITGMSDVELPPDIIDRSLEFHKMVECALCLAWTCVFSIKFSFLFFFRSLIERVGTFTPYWWTVVTLSIIVWVGGMIGFWMSCPYYTDTRALSCGQGPSFVNTIGVAVGMTIGDILTDAMIIAIPLRILSQVRIKASQKLALSLSLCLSIIMIIVTIIRASGLKAKGARVNTVDVLWEVYWQLAESWIAVTMVCITAFRSLFVQTTKESSSDSLPRKWYNVLKRSLWTHGHREQRAFAGGDDERKERSLESLPSAPDAVITGLKTFIDEYGRTRSDTDGSIPGDQWSQPDSMTFSSNQRRYSDSSRHSNTRSHTGRISHEDFV